MIKGIQVEYFNEINIEAVKSFYQQTTYQSAGSASAEDEIVAALDGENIIGLYRLCTEAGVCVLRGFFVLEAYRHKGIGTRMLHKLNEVLNGRTCYLICRRQTNPFYAKAGFIIGDDTVSAHLLERKNKYNNPEMNILVRRGA